MTAAPLTDEADASPTVKCCDWYTYGGSQPKTQGHIELVSLFRGAAVHNVCSAVALQIYAAMCGKTGRPYHLYRLILLTPAGFLKKTPWVRTETSSSCKLLKRRPWIPAAVSLSCPAQQCASARPSLTWRLQTCRLAATDLSLCYTLFTNPAGAVATHQGRLVA